jgi:N-methylhydantoinase B
VEPLEAQYPFVVRSARLLPDSGGPGAWRGGLGVETVIELLSPARLTVRGDRLAGHPPPGTRGGEAGRPGSFSVERIDGSVETLAARQTDVHLAPGDRFVLRTSGGGGLGPARDRDHALVRDDIATGKVTREGASRDYGVDS